MGVSPAGKTGNPGVETRRGASPCEPRFSMIVLNIYENLYSPRRWQSGLLRRSYEPAPHPERGFESRPARSLVGLHV